MATICPHAHIEADIAQDLEAAAVGRRKIFRNILKRDRRGRRSGSAFRAGAGFARLMSVPLVILRHGSTSRAIPCRCPLRAAHDLSRRWLARHTSSALFTGRTRAGLRNNGIAWEKVRIWKLRSPKRTASCPSPTRFSSTMSAISCAIRRPRPARSLRAGFAPTPVSVQVNPDADGRHVPPAPATSRRCLRAAISRCCSRPRTRRSAASSRRDGALSRRASRGLRGGRCRERASAARRRSGFRVQPLVEIAAPGRHRRGAGTAAFTLARVEPGEMPEGRIQILTHRTEPMVWQPRWLSHPNGALALTSIMIVAAEVAEAARRFARFTGRQATATASGESIDARPWADRPRQRRGVCAAAAGNPDPLAALRRRLRDQGGIAGALDELLQRAGFGAAERARLGTVLTAPGCSAARNARVTYARRWLFAGKKES